MDDTNDNIKITRRNKDLKTKNKEATEPRVADTAEYNYLLADYKENAELIKHIINLGVILKLNHETVKAWVEFFNQYAHIPLHVVEDRMQEGDNTFLENNKYPEGRIKRITAHAKNLGYSQEDSKEWGNICGNHPYICEYAIKEEIEQHNRTPGNFIAWLNQTVHHHAMMYDDVQTTREMYACRDTDYDDLYGVYAGEGNSCCSII